MRNRGPVRVGAAGPVTRGVPGRPGAVGIDRRAFEVADLQLIEAGFDQDGHPPAVQGDFDCLLRPWQGRPDREIDVQIGELRAKGARLGFASCGQR